MSNWIALNSFVMFAEFIDRPISGRYPEHHFGKATPYAAWVLFTDKNYEQWVGSFERGWVGFATLIINIQEIEKALIVVGGEGYLIEIRRQVSLNKTELSAIKTAIADLERQRIIFSDGLNLKCLDFEGNVSIFFGDYFFDDIELLEVSDNILFAQYWYYQRNSTPFSFEMNVITKEIKDSYHDIEVESTKQNTKTTTIEKIKKWFKK